MITGYATPEGTKKFAERQNQNSHKNYKNIQIGRASCRERV